LRQCKGNVKIFKTPKKKILFEIPICEISNSKISKKRNSKFQKALYEQLEFGI